MLAAGADVLRGSALAVWSFNVSCSHVASGGTSCAGAETRRERSGCKGCHRRNQCRAVGPKSSGCTAQRLLRRGDEEQHQRCLCARLHYRCVFFAATCSGACSLTSAPSGTGGFAVVLQAMHRASRAAVAVKVLSLSTARIVETGVRQLARCRYKSLTSCAGLGSCADDAHGCAFAAVWCCARCGRRGRDAGGASLEEHRPVRQQAR